MGTFGNFSFAVSGFLFLFNAQSLQTCEKDNSWKWKQKPDEINGNQNKTMKKLELAFKREQNGEKYVFLLHYFFVGLLVNWTEAVHSENSCTEL